MSHMLLVAALGEVSPSMRDSTTSYGPEDSELPGGEELVQSQLGASFIFCGRLIHTSLKLSMMPLLGGERLT